jgi:hypothetical protein
VGFSALLVPGIWLGLKAPSSAALVLGASLVLFAAATYLLLLSAAGQRLWPATALLAGVLVIHPAVLRAADAILSDLPFAVLSTIAFGLAVRVVEREKPSRAAISGLALALAGASLVRWAGLYLTVALAIGLLATLPGRDRPGGTVRITLGVVALPLLAVGASLARNALLAGSWTGPREAADIPLWELATDAARGIGAGFLASRAAFDHPELAFLYRACGTLGALGFVWILVRGGAWRERAPRLLLYGAIVYAFFILASASLSTMDRLSQPRFWIALWPLLGAAGLAILVRSSSYGWLRATTAGLLCVSLLVAGHAFSGELAASFPRPEARRGLLDPGWLRTAPVRLALEQGDRCTLLSNDPRVLIAHADLGPLYTLPVSLEEIEPVLGSDTPLCIAYFSRRMAPSVERRRSGNRAVLAALQSRGTIELVARDRVGEFWRSP